MISSSSIYVMSNSTGTYSSDPSTTTAAEPTYYGVLLHARHHRRRSFFFPLGLQPAVARTRARPDFLDVYLTELSTVIAWNDWVRKSRVTSSSNTRVFPICTSAAAMFGAWGSGRIEFDGEDDLYLGLFLSKLTKFLLESS